MGHLILTTPPSPKRANPVGDLPAARDAPDGASRCAISANKQVKPCGQNTT